MIESYSVGSVFKIGDEFTGPLAKLAEKLAGIQGTVDKLQSSLKRLGDVKATALLDGLGSVEKKFGALTAKADGTANAIKAAFRRTDDTFTETGRKIAGLGTSFGDLDGKAKAAMEGVAANFTRTDGAIEGTIAKVGDLTRAFEGVKAASSGIGRLPRSGGSHPRPGQGGGSGGGAGGGSGGGHGGRHWGGLLTSHGELADAGLASMMADAPAIEMVKSIVEAGAKIEHFQSQLEAVTGSATKMQEATQAAWAETSRNLNTTVADNLKNIQELMQVTGSLDEAQRMLHPFTQANTVLQSLSDGELRAGLTGGKGEENNTYNFARSLEQLGVTQDEKQLDSYAESLTRMMIGMQGKMDGTKLFQGINNAGGARYGWSQDFVTYGLGPLLQATNGRAGAQLYQLSRSFGQGVSTEMMAHGAEKYGLWSKEDEVFEAGKYKGMRVGSVFEADTLKHDPVKWAGDVREMMRKRGINVDDTDTMTNAVAEMTRGNKNLGAIMDELILPKSYAALMKERANIEGVGPDAMGSLQKNDPSIAMTEFTKQWENLLGALGKPLVKDVAYNLGMMASGLNKISLWVEQHPDAARTIAGALIGVAGGLTALAGVGLAIFAGPTAVGIVALTALGSALAGLIAINYDKLWADMKKLGEIPGLIGNAIGGMVSGIMSKLRALPGIGHYFDPAPPHEARDKDDAYTPPLTPEQKRWWNSGHFGLPGFGLLSFEQGASNDNSPLTLAVRDGFLAAFGQLMGGGLPGMGGSGTGGGLINASFETGSSGLAGAGSIGAAGGTFLPGAPGGAVDTALKLQGLGSRGAATALGAHMTNGEWCADFVNGALAANGIKGSGSSAALSFSHWGRAIDLAHAQKGDVAFENHGGGHGHAMLLTGEHDGRGWLGVIAGNSRGGRVEHYWENPSKIAGIRRAYSVGAPHRTTPGKPASGAIQASAQPPIHIALHLDKKVIGRHIVKGVETAMRFPTDMGGPDTHGTYTSPGTPLTDAA